MITNDKLGDNGACAYSTEEEDAEEHSTEDAGNVQPQRGSWSNIFEFMMSSLSYAVGLGNVWRFPYLCYRNGGGAFLLPYGLAMVLVGMPVCLLQKALGQFTSCSPISCRNYAPVLKGLGFCQLVLNTINNIYYMMVVAWAWFYLFASFTKALPWDTCGGWWNTEACDGRVADITCNGTGLVKEVNGTCYNGSELQGVWDYKIFANQIGKETVLASEEYFNHRVLSISTGIEILGPVKWELFLCNSLAWVICFICLFKSIKTAGKVAYVTCIGPYVLLTVLLGRAVSLPNAAQGILYFLIPKWSYLLDVRVWYDATAQILFSLGLAGGNPLTLASYNKFHNNILWQSVLVVALNSVASILAGFTVFGFLGFMAWNIDATIDEVATAGAGLAFVAFPALVTQMSLSTMWSILFFLTLVMLGTGSMIVSIETSVACIVDELRWLLRYKTALTGIMCALSCLVSLPMCSHGGVYVVTLFDHYTGGALTVITVLVEIISIGWIYGPERFLNDIRIMIGRKPSAWWKFCWVVASPAAILFILVMMFVQYAPARYGKDYYYPIWADCIGWLIVTAGLVWIPVVAVYKVVKEGKGRTLLQKLRHVCRPTRDWGPVEIKHRLLVDYVKDYVVDPWSQDEELKRLSVANL